MEHFLGAMLAVALSNSEVRWLLEVLTRGPCAPAFRGLGFGVYGLGFRVRVWASWNLLSDRKEISPKS